MKRILAHFVIVVLLVLSAPAQGSSQDTFYRPAPVSGLEYVVSGGIVTLSWQPSAQAVYYEVIVNGHVLNVGGATSVQGVVGPGSYDVYVYAQNWDATSHGEYIHIVVP